MTRFQFFAIPGLDPSAAHAELNGFCARRRHRTPVLRCRFAVVLGDLCQQHTASLSFRRRLGWGSYDQNQGWFSNERLVSPAIRGGSWINKARRVRSPYRNRNHRRNFCPSTPPVAGGADEPQRTLPRLQNFP